MQLGMVKGKSRLTGWRRAVYRLYLWLMIRHGTLSFYRSVLRGLTPSPESTIFCVMVGVFIAVVHLVYASTLYGTLAPDAYSGDFGLYYTNQVVGPLQQLFNNSLFTNLTGVVLWGLMGLVVFECFSLVVRSVAVMHETDTEVGFYQDPRVVRRRLRIELFKRFLWRVAVGTLTLVALSLTLPWVRFALMADKQLVTHNLSIGTALRVVLEILVWALVFHILVVFLRFYTFRTRLHGDDEALR